MRLAGNKSSVDQRMNLRASMFIKQIPGTESILVLGDVAVFNTASKADNVAATKADIVVTRVLIQRDQFITIGSCSIIFETEKIE